MIPTKSGFLRKLFATKYSCKQLDGYHCYYVRLYPHEYKSLVALFKKQGYQYYFEKV